METLSMQTRPAAPVSIPKPATRAFTGNCGVYSSHSTPNSVRLSFTVPTDLAKAFKHESGCVITRLDDETFEIKPHPTNRTPRFFMTAHGDFQLVSERTIPRNPGTKLWGSSPAEFLLVDGHILARCPTVTRRKKSVVPVDPTAVKVTIPAPPAPRTLDQSLDEATMKMVLTTVQRIEAATPYRLVKLESGWAWRAPTIRLEG